MTDAGRGRVTVVGLGPAGADLVTSGTLAALELIPQRLLRTDRHPAAAVVAGAATFDHVYDEAATFDEVYRRIAEEVVAAAGRHGEVLYAVPGSPRVLERTVDHLAADAVAGLVELVVLPALSFLDLAWVRLGVDPFEDGVRLVDAHRFAERAAGERGPPLVAHCHNRRVLSDVKLAVEDPPAGPVTVLQRLGSGDEAVFEVAWAELDRSFEPDHLTALWVPALAAPIAGEVVAFVELVAILRRECPWDRRQTHASLTRHLLEETYEVLEAVDALGSPGDGAGDGYGHLEEELGDLLLQIVLHSTLAAEQGAFTFADVARGIHDKLVRRHPHVFEGAPADDLAGTWDRLKAEEKGRASVMDGIPAALPALAYAAKVARRAESVLGARPLPVVRDDLAASAAMCRTTDDAATLGRLLYAAADLARHLDLDPEALLRRAANERRDEAMARERA
ncbi:hypothetical protein BH20ACT2_BH20ACT2_13730 [soil metagenome]